MITWEEISPIVSAILQAVLLATIPPLAAVIGVWVNAKANEIKAKIREMNPTVADYLEEAVEVGVLAAEQAGLKGLIDNKLVYAQNVAESWLKMRGVTLDLEVITGAIEAKVATALNAERLKLNTGAITTLPV